MYLQSLKCTYLAGTHLNVVTSVPSPKRCPKTRNQKSSIRGCQTNIILSHPIIFIIRWIYASYYDTTSSCPLDMSLGDPCYVTCIIDIEIVEAILRSLHVHAAMYSTLLFNMLRLTRWQLLEMLRSCLVIHVGPIIVYLSPEPARYLQFLKSTYLAGMGVQFQKTKNGMWLVKKRSSPRVFIVKSYPGPQMLVLR